MARFRWNDASEKSPDDDALMFVALWRPDHGDFFHTIAAWDGLAWREQGYEDNDLEANCDLSVVWWSVIPEPKIPKGFIRATGSQLESRVDYTSIVTLGLSEAGKRALLIAGIYGINDLAEKWEEVRSIPDLSPPDLNILSESMASLSR